MKFNYTLTFHNVGQGLFYTGRIHDFNFVYDCGCQGIQIILHEAIDRYLSSIISTPGRPTIDMVVFSHLHYDHVSGIYRLLKKASISLAIIPHFLPLERLLLAIESKLDLPKWYYEFLSDPVMFLKQSGVKEIIVISRGHDGTNDEPQFNSDDNAGQRISVRLLDEPRVDQCLGDDPQWKGERVSIKSHYGYISIVGIWEFIFFNNSLRSKIGRSSLNKCATKIVNIGNMESVRSIIRDRQQLKALKECYRGVFGDLNDISLVLYHGPVQDWPVKQDVAYLFPYVPCCSPSYASWRFPCNNDICNIISSMKTGSNCSYLLTGDIKLTTQTCIGLSNHLGKRRTNSIIACQIPHHGSGSSWNKQIMSKFPRCYFWVVSSGIKNRYDHPSSEVISDIVSKGCVVPKVNEFCCFTFNGSFIWP